MKKSKPGDMYNAFQKKKAKHMKKKKSYSESDMGSMKGYNPNLGLSKAQYRTTTTPKAVNSRVPGGSFVNSRSVGIPSVKGVANSTKMMAKKKHSKTKKHKKAVKTTGKFQGKSNKLGHGGRAAQLKAQGVPGGVIGNLARAAHAAKGQANYHGKKHRKEHSAEAIKGMRDFVDEEAKEKAKHSKKHSKHKKGVHCKTCSCA